VSETGRTEAFSDGVLAIAITLLVLDLRVPLAATLHGSLARALAHEWPAYAAYVTSFLIIGIIWVNHHGVVAHFLIALYYSFQQIRPGRHPASG
jgi:uncharacterized membrane protein